MILNHGGQKQSYNIRSESSIDVDPTINFCGGDLVLIDHLIITFSWAADIVYDHSEVEFSDTRQDSLIKLRACRSL